MDTLLKGIHHITLCPGGAQEDVDFFTKVLGQRLVKQTVLMDGSIPIYHFYYGNAGAEIGSILTCFPYSRRAGRPGSGQISATSYSVPEGSTAFWVRHLDRHGVDHDGIQERFGTKYIRLRHPAGLSLELMESPDDTRQPWITPEIGPDAATRGFFGAVMSVRDVVEQELFLTGALRMRKVGVDGAYHRFEIPGGAFDRTIELHHEPDRPSGSWTFGAGTFHHIAFNVETDDALVAQKALYEELGYTDASEVKDRFYFHSMYVRSPGGVLVECTATVPGGFFLDETPEQLGRNLNLPPWYEDQRAEVLAQLEPVTVPEANRPLASRSARPARPTLEAPAPAIELSRTKAEFSSRRS
jgi:glyoxalase family protein